VNMVDICAPIYDDRTFPDIYQSNEDNTHSGDAPSPPTAFQH
jgi:hypothetical protein